MTLPGLSVGDEGVPRDRAARLAAWDRDARPTVTPSLLACDFSVMSEELEALALAGVSGVHLDVMDGRFVPNLTYGAPLIARWRERSALTFDAHLMIEAPQRYLDAFVQAGCDVLTIHIEAVADPGPILEAIRASGCRAGLTLNPPTPVTAILPWVDAGLVDVVLVMSVTPGFGGQTFDASVLDKVRTLRARRPDLAISIDGGITPVTAPQAVAAGVTQLVAGSSVFRSGVADPNLSTSSSCSPVVSKSQTYARAVRSLIAGS